METPFDDNYFMKKALEEAEMAFESDEVPVGAVVVANNRIIGRGHNLTERLNDVTAHAEMQAVTAAANFLGAKFLIDCTLYVTLEPCAMCAGALYWAQLSRIIYAAKDPKRGFLTTGPQLHPRTILEQGPYGEEAQKLLQDFFKKKR
ncbi:MAG: nucleoside deaminase [Bacteroidetes bacterium]|nr:nucleoside deaminase [Bacteroidota bacterium]MDA0950803.1 nucleoside deaminase [Bacteroidota bacterium]